MTGADRYAFEAADLAPVRSALYRILATLFQPPTRERLQEVVTATEAVQNLDVFAFYPAWERLVQSLHQALDVPMGRLEATYDDLFGTRLDGVRCPPQETFYRAPSGTEQGLILGTLEQTYARFGIELPAEVRPHLDHVSVELDVMAVLCQQEARAWTQSDLPAAHRALTKQRRFLLAHLGGWLPVFCSRLQEADADGLYGALGRATHAFVRHETDLVVCLLQALPPHFSSGGPHVAV